MSTNDSDAEQRYAVEREREAQPDERLVRADEQRAHVHEWEARAERGAVATRRPHVGVNWGAAFFGWVAAMGLAVILTALVAAVGAAVGVTRGTTVTQASDQLAQDPRSVGIAGGVVLAVVIFLAYFCGGYVAARMSRFEGIRQGFGVWAWAVIVAVVVAIVAAVAGAKYDVLSSLNSFPRLPVNQGDLTTGGVVALVALLVDSLIGALVGGLAGMRYHRRLEAYEPVPRD